MLGNVDGKNDMLCSRRHNERSIRVIEVVVGMQEIAIAVTLILRSPRFRIGGIRSGVDDVRVSTEEITDSTKRVF